MEIALDQKMSACTETLIIQWDLFICSISMCYVPASRITTAVFLPPPPEDLISSPLYPFCLYEVEMASATHFRPKHFLHLVTKNRKRDN